MSAKFSLRLFNHPKKVMIKGVSRTISRGVPTQILQQEVTTKERINYVKVTVNAYVLEGLSALDTFPLVACSIYDTKPVHFFSVCCNNITWLEKTRRTWDKSTITMRLGSLLCLEINDSYNMNMNNVDISDQLRGSYRHDRWMRTQKWWWSVLFWGHGTLLVNAYVA